MSGLAAAGVTSIPVRENRSPLRQVFEGSVWNAVAIVAARLAPGLLTILLTQWLSPGELGSVAFVLAYYGVLSLLADWSIAYSVQKIVPENIGMESQIAGTALLIRLSFSVLLAIVCWSLDVSMGLFRGYGVHLGLLLVTSSFGIVVCLKNAKCNFGASSLLNILFQAGWICAAVVFVMAGMRTTGPLFALAISYALFGIPALLFGFFRPKAFKFVPRIGKEILVFGGWATLAACLSGVGTQGGLLVLAYAAGDQSAGIYRIAMTFGMLPAILGNIVLMPLMPVVKRNLLDGKDFAQTLAIPMLRQLLMLGLPICAIAAIFAKSILAAFVSQSYSSAAGPMYFCVVANVFAMLVTAFSGILFVGDGLKQLARIHAVIGSTVVLGTLILARAGALGAAIASMTAWLSGSVYLHHWLRQKVELTLEWKVYCRYAVFAFIGAGFGFFATQAIHSPPVRSSLGACAAAAAYGLLLWSQRDYGFLQLAKAIRTFLPVAATFNFDSGITK